jgi:diguanylate cyclase (GGDEF)-like protein
VTRSLRSLPARTLRQTALRRALLATVRRHSVGPLTPIDAPGAPGSVVRSRREGGQALARIYSRLRIERDSLESRIRDRTQQLEQSRADLLEAQRLAGLGSWSYRPRDRSFEVSSQLAALLGWPVEHGVRSVRDLIAHVIDADRATARQAVAAAMREPCRLSAELRVHDAQGQVRWFACTIASEADASGRVQRVHGAMLDVNARRLAESRVQRLAYQDDLTGLPNRAAFMEHIGHAARRAKTRGARFALLFLDLDGFKEINDALGHEAGDDLLRQVAARIRACLRQGDGLARFGGDEFLVLIDPVRRREDVETVTRKILKTVATPLALDGLMATVSASIGIAMFPDDGEEAQQLLKNADAAMYFAKRNGRNAMRFYAPQINASAREKVALINDLRAAVSQGHLSIAYQPIVDGTDGRLLGLEALSRWTHPVRGPVPPGVFVPLAEETGLIGSIGATVLERACAQLVAWDAQHGAQLGYAPPYLSVNVSPVQLREDGFVDALRSMLRVTGVNAQRLQLELTEGSVMEDPQRAARVLGELSDMGLRIALDDFGTGYSSLAYLRTFPIDCIKIDRAFVGDLGQDGRHEPIVPAIVAIAKNLGAGVVAEGVESDIQRQALLALGCSRMQGYLFSRPLPTQEVAVRFLDSQAEASGRDEGTVSASHNRE